MAKTPETNKKPRKNNRKMSSPQPGQLNFFYILLAVFGTFLLRDLWIQKRDITHIPYSQYQSYLEQGKVKDVVISDQLVRGNFTEPLDGKSQFVTNRVPLDVVDQLKGKGIEYRAVVENTFLRDLLSWVVPVLLFFGLWVLLIRRMGKGIGGQMMSIGKSRAKVYVESDTKTSFNDVAGVDESKEELEEVVDFLKNPQEGSRLGARMPKGILLVGPPGTGKTLLAKAVAGEAGVPFFSINGSEFVEMFVGVGAARVRDLFEQAKKQAPCIIFIDELDALGKARGAAGMPGGGHDEKEQTLNQLLVELDGFDSGVGIVLIGATNRPEVLDPALLRAGRFDRQVLVDRPDKKGRVAILKVHIGRVRIAKDVALEDVAALTPGFTGADLANLVNEAALVATRRGGEAVELNDFSVAVERIVAGLEKKNRLLNEFERRVVAHHEMGHALVGASLPGSDEVHKVSIIPRGIGALGYTIQRPTEDRYLMTSKELERKMTVLLGGRAAERIIFDHLSTGASDDIAKATDIARNMVTRYGMDERLGNMSYDKEPGGFLSQGYSTRDYSDSTAREIDEAIQKLVNQSLGRAETILRANEALLKESAEELLTKETLDGKELKTIFGKLTS